MQRIRISRARWFLRQAAAELRTKAADVVPSTMITAIRFEKIAVDNGFDLELGRFGDWVCYGSTRVPLRLWFARTEDGSPGSEFVAAFSDKSVASAVDFGVPVAGPLPMGARGARAVASFVDLHKLVRQAFQISRDSVGPAAQRLAARGLRMKQGGFQTPGQMATVFGMLLDRAFNSLDLSTIQAVHTILDHEHSRGIEGLKSMVEHDPAGFFLTAAPGFEKALLRATGRDRKWWVSMLPALPTSR